MSTNTGPLNMTSASLGNTVTATEDIAITSGGDLLLSNTGNGNEDVRFNGVGVVFSTTQGPLQMTSVGAASGNAQAITIQSVGTSSTSRDRVLFDTDGNSLLFNAGSAHVDATELFSVGLTTTPDVTFNAVGSAANDAIDINSAGNIDITSDTNVAFTPTGTFHSQSQSDAHFSGFDGVRLESTAGGVSLESIGGTLNFLADQDVLLTANDIRLTSEGIMQLNQNSAADPVEFVITNGMEVISEGVISNLIDGDATYTAQNNVQIFSDTNSGGHKLNFAASEDIQVTANNNIQLSSGDILDVLATDGDLIFTSVNSYTVTTNGDFSDVSFSAVDGNVEINTATLTTLSDRVIFSALSSGGGSTGAIDVDVDAVTFTATGSSSGASAVKGNIVTEALGDVTIEAAATLFTVAESFSLIAHEDVDLDTAITTITTGRVTIETELHRGGMIEFDAPLIGVAVDQANFNGQTEMEITSPIVLIQSLDDDIEFLSTGASHELAGIEIDSTAGITFDPAQTLLLSAGSDRYSGDILWDVAGDFTWTGDTFTMRQLIQIGRASCRERV